MKIKEKIINKLNAIVRRGYWYNNILFPECKKFWFLKSFNLEVVNLGSTSGVNAFNYDGIPIKAANWALEQNPLLGDKELLYNYFSFLNPKKSVVIISLCPFSSLSGSYNDFCDYYYTLLNFASIPNGSIRRKNKIQIIKETPLRYYPLFQIINDIKMFIWKKKQRVLSEKEMEINAEIMLNSWMREFSITDFSYPLSMVNCDGIEDAAIILNEIIIFCKERNITPVILIPPVYRTLGKLLTPSIRELIIDSLIEKIKDRNVWFHNYMDDSDFSNDISLFRNSFLMNKKGARLFTIRVLRDLKIIQQ